MELANNRKNRKAFKLLKTINHDKYFKMQHHGLKYYNRNKR